MQLFEHSTMKMYGGVFLNLVTRWLCIGSFSVVGRKLLHIKEGSHWSQSWYRRDDEERVALMGVKPVVVCPIGSHIVIERSWFPVS